MPVTGERRAGADDWPQWRGPQRNAVSAETGLLRSWPEGGPKVAWKASALGSGYASVVVRRGLLFTIGRQDRDVVVTALAAATGKRLWARKIGTTSRIPCSTPTVDDDRLYALSPEGELVCLKAASGAIVWQRSFVKDFGGRMMSGRGYGESPLIDADKLICTPGGPDAALVALDKRTGEVLWKAKTPDLGASGKDGAGFASVVVTKAAGIRQYVQLMGRGLIGVEARDGRFLWGYNAIANDTANIPTPVVREDLVFAANGYNAGSVLLRLRPAPRPGRASPGVQAEVV
ncbi:MAG: PQQ-like beta-propeller repeat protein, partial [Planctomycetes bacterium]|nr:PQQ-like beta-propeller repeat protein [Planctomycetota bacterium]